jgi:hypothetical protein
MKKVLIIAHSQYAFPGMPKRILDLAKYLPEFGWQPIIITPVGKKPDIQTRIIETPYSDALDFWKRLFNLNLDEDEDIRRHIMKRLGVTSKKSFIDPFLTLCGEIINYPDGEKGWTPFAVKAGSELLQRENIDAIISSSAPVTSHIIAQKLKMKYNIPWVADFRDLWTQNHNYGYGPLRKLIDRCLELKTLSKADALVTVSPVWAEKLRTMHKREAVYTITNGFDPTTVNIPPANLTAKFTITYTGGVFVGKQDPSKLFAALQDLFTGGFMNPNDVEVRFYGPKEGWLARDIEEYRLSAIVKQYGVVSREIALEKQRDSQILLHLTWEGLGERAGYSLKLFEYLAAQRPILATGLGNDLTRELLDETKSGIYAPTVEDIKSILRKLYTEYKNKGEISYNGDRGKINNYNCRKIVRRYVEILESIS